MPAKKSKKATQKKRGEAVLHSSVCETRVFKSGNSLAVRLPKEIHIKQGRVLIFERAGEIIITKIPETIGDIWRLQPKLPNNVTIESPKDDVPQKRDFVWK